MGETTSENEDESMDEGGGVKGRGEKEAVRQITSRVRVREEESCEERGSHGMACVRMREGRMRE